MTAETRDVEGVAREIAEVAWWPMDFEIRISEASKRNNILDAPMGGVSW